LGGTSAFTRQSGRGRTGNGRDPQERKDIKNGVDAGGLDESWRQQPGTPVYGTDFDAEGRHALSEANKDRSPERRAA
jgi:hypothetical protein